MNKKSVSLIALALAAVFAGSASAAVPTNAELTVQATIVSACEVTGTPVIDFGDITALASKSNKTANSADGFAVACSSSAQPKLYATGTRAMSDGNSHSLPFSLSLTNGGGSLAADGDSAVALDITQDGTLQPVTIYGGVATSNYQALPDGDYTASITLVVAY